MANILRQYQKEIISDIMQAARASKRILVQSATGSGKSVIFAELIRRATEKGKQTLFLVHRRELIYQTDRHLKRHGIQTGIIMSGEQYAPGCQVQLGSVPTVYRRLKKIDMSRFAFVVLDECHHASSMTNKKIIEGVNGAHVLGFTATPIRKAGAPLGDVFDMMVQGPKVQDLIDQGHLCDVEYMVPNPVDLRGVASVGGDYSEKGLQEKVVPKLIGGVVDHYLKYGGKKGIIFTCGKKHSNYLRDEFAKNGRTALVIDSDTKDDERAEMEKEFRDGETGILLNVGIFTEGYDVPDCDTMVLARPTKSLGLYLQMTGRGMRPKPDGGKLLVIDHGANVYRHGRIEEEIQWSLTESRDKESLKDQQSDRLRKYASCANCGMMITGRRCHACGHEITPIERARNVRELKNCGLILLDKKIEAKKKKVGSAAGWKSLVSYAAMNGRKLGYAVHMYKARYGSLPWLDRLGVALPKGKQWDLSAKDWLSIKEA